MAKLPHPARSSGRWSDSEVGRVVAPPPTVCGMRGGRTHTRAGGPCPAQLEAASSLTSDPLVGRSGRRMPLTPGPHGRHRVSAVAVRHAKPTCTNSVRTTGPNGIRTSKGPCTGPRLTPTTPTQPPAEADPRARAESGSRECLLIPTARPSAHSRTYPPAGSAPRSACRLEQTP